MKVGGWIRLYQITPVMGLSGSKTDHPLLAAIAAGNLDEVKKIPLGGDKTLDNITDSVRPIIIQ